MKQSTAALLVLFMILFCPPAYAIESTTYTYTLATDGRFIRTQDAYLPGSVLLREVGLKSPADLCLSGETMYIADTGNNRLVRYELAEGDVAFLGLGVLNQPTGVAVASNGRIFVADYGSSSVVILDAAGTKVIGTIRRPASALYGASTPFKPQKLVIDFFGNLYVTSEGTHEGILQFDLNGNFAGFFGANKANALNLVEWIQEKFYTVEQKERLLLRNPPRIVNVDLGADNLLYSVTQFRPKESVKKLNMAGVNIFAGNHFVGENNLVDVAIGPGGEIFAVTSTGAITEYDQDGTYLFAFGGRAISADRNGLTSVVSALAVDEEYNVFVLDKQRGVVQPYLPTDFAHSIHEGLALYAAGSYAAAADIWGDFLRLTPRGAFAHWGYGLALWQLGNYAQAQYHLELVGAREYASDAFWELRNAWLMAHLGQILLWAVVFFVIWRVLKIVRANYDFLRPLTTFWAQARNRCSLLGDLAFMKHMIRHPIDAGYDLKHGKHGSVFAATVLYFLALVVWLVDQLYAARLFGSDLFVYKWQNPLVITSLVVVPVVLFVIGNYLISSIHDGEGTFKNVYIAVAYAFSAYILFTPLLTLLTHFLTLNEAFIHTLLKLVVVGYTLVLIFVATKETHDYSLNGTTKNLLLTVFFMVLVILAMAIMYMIWNELIGFITSLVEEVRYRV